MSTPLDLLPSQQHPYEGLQPVDELTLHDRREAVFLVLAALFIGTLAMLNILGISRFIPLLTIGDAGPAFGTWGESGDLVFAVAVGVLPYPLTFLCTDFISELFGRRRANQVVWAGLIVNIWVIAVLWFAGIMPPVPPQASELARSAIPTGAIDPATGTIPDELIFYRIRALAFGAVLASMIAYLVAQLVDVHMFHFWRRLTRGRAKWLRNNGSTLVSQLVDTTAVILITHFLARALPIDDGRSLWPQLGLFIATGYTFKLLAALIDTVPFYLCTPLLQRYLRLPPAEVSEHRRSGAGEAES